MATLNYRFYNFILLFCFLMVLPGCDLVEGIFKLGAWTIIIALVIVVSLLVLIFTKASTRLG